jgi:heme oxygenase (biliverdin-IX-beta and delta-forming)
LTALPLPELRLADRLRHETGPAHRQLEARIGFDVHRPSRSAALAMLKSFASVLQQLEPAMLALLPKDLVEGRAKLDLLHRDLQSLGVPADETASLPTPRDLRLPQSQAEALGMLYVFEGSTLGGKVIVKALRRLPDWPIHGISYFDPYGSSTGAMWQAFREHLDATPKADEPEVIGAAQGMFSLLERVMTPETAA